ncbi:hypothetical protein FN846DRAFT_940476 [Sphaerosporella brunnea]|uniref:Uncharacterized protein n=1 Tax=Sphaerosporella brunnea TaxID=1250544 RepID=A0A5J5F1U0_9PEZI|nr:hypothetical protein FN846DRAFT_940476 [Sphaerosporella brunnea]
MSDPAQIVPDAPEDDFAQTREDDDLFESEIQPSAPPAPSLRAPREPRAFRRGGGGGGEGGLAQSRHSPSNKLVAAVEEAKKADRLLSGGIQKPKLTDKELAARMEQVKLNNARLTARAQKVAEDETSFQHLEEQRKAQDAVKRQQEKKKRIEAEKNRRELDEEREKNRQRKLKAVQNREWDSEKKEEDYNPRGYNPRFRRGAHGGVAGPPRNIDPNTHTMPAKVVAKLAPPKVVAPEDNEQWPDLAGAKKKAENKGGEQMKALKTDLAEMSPAVGSWADQVEDGSPATPTAANAQ